MQPCHTPTHTLDSALNPRLYKSGSVLTKIPQSTKRLKLLTVLEIDIPCKHSQLKHISSLVSLLTDLINFLHFF